MEVAEANSNGFYLKRKLFNDYNFVQALRELAKHPLDIKVAWNISRIIKQGQKVIDDGQTLVKEILDKHVEKDENGKYKNDEKGGDFLFKNKAEFQVEYDAFGEQDVFFKSFKINLDTLSGVKIPAETIGALGPVIDE